MSKRTTVPLFKQQVTFENKTHKHVEKLHVFMERHDPILDVETLNYFFSYVS